MAQKVNPDVNYRLKLIIMCDQVTNIASSSNKNNTLMQGINNRGNCGGDTVWKISLSSAQFFVNLKLS